MMNNILKFHLNKKEKYSDKWLLNIKPVAIAKYILKKACYEISWRAARALADAKIKNVYKELVLEEETQNLKEETLEGSCEE